MKRRALLSVIGTSCTLLSGCSGILPASGNNSTTLSTDTTTMVERGGQIEAEPVGSTDKPLIAAQEVEQLPLLYETILDAAHSGEKVMTEIDAEEMNRIESHVDSLTGHEGDWIYFSVEDHVIQVTLIHNL